MIFGFHHINMDGISFEVFWSDVEKAYQGIPLSQDRYSIPRLHHETNPRI